MFSARAGADRPTDGAVPVCLCTPVARHRSGRMFIHPGSGFTHLAAMAFLFAALLGCWLWAGDSWEKKPYGEWTESEALKVLQDSAWSKLSFVWVNSEVLAVEPKSRTASGEAHIEEHSNCCRTFTRIVDGAPAGDNPLDDTSTDRPVSVRRVVSYRVLLFSSVRVRQALARLSQLRGGIWDLQADGPLERPMEDLVIAVAGPDMQPFGNPGDKTLLGSIYLRSKKGNGAKAELKDIVPPGVRQDGLALFVFSRRAGGKPLFSAVDDLVEFGAGEGAFRIRASFKLEKTVVNGVPDF